MSWNAVPPEVRAAAEAVCTKKQLEAVKLQATGASTRHVAKLMGISRATAREHLAVAHHKIAAHLEQETLNASSAD